jgi:hypothetical protein
MSTTVGEPLGEQEHDGRQRLSRDGAPWPPKLSSNRSTMADDVLGE